MALRSRRHRRQTPGRFILREPQWIDPYPHIPGTEPEKRVFALLVQMRVYFIYQGQIPEFEKGNPWYTLAPPNYKPDFVLPEYRLIIDPFSPFHHSLQEAVERDVVKVASYTMAGYAYYHPWALGGNRWSWDQYHDARKQITVGKTRIRLYSGVNAAENSYRNLSRNLSGQAMSTAQMLQSIPELMQGPRYKLTDKRDIDAKRSPGYRIGEHLGAGATSVGAANSRRRSTPIMDLTAGQRRLRRRR